jgi:hypothetical protein
MSLQVLAQDMASRGRGPDTMLVHMAPKEVYGLQALARAHGGSLSINPQTGLPEAGFLSSLLPTLIGVGLTVATGGAVTPLMAGLGVGGLQALRTGSLGKGLMAGLGAYGGAGLMGGVMGAGTGAVSGAAGAEGVGAYAANPANALQPIEAIVPPAPVATPYFPEGVGGEFMRPAYGQGALGSGSFNVAQDAAALTNTGAGGYMNAPVATANPMVAPPTVMPAQAFPSATGVAPQYGLTQEAINIGDIYGQEQAAQNAVAQKLATTTPMDTAKAGIESIFKDPSKFLTKDNLKYGLAAAAPGIASLMAPKTAAQAPVDREQMQFAFDPGRLTPPTRMGDVGEYTYFRPSYTRLAAEGGTMTSDYTYDPETQLYSREKTPPQQDRASSGNAGPYTIGVSDPTPNGFQDLTNAQQQAFYETNPTMAAVTRGGQTLMGLTSLGMLSNALNPVANAQHAFNATPNAQANMDAMNVGMNIGQIEAGGGGGDVGSGGGGMSNAGEGGGGPGSPGWAKGGISHLGDYSDGGRLLRGPGDGVSDSIPATIANKRPARLADGEFVVPARIVSELGNGSTEAGARKLYAMMDRIQKNRTKSVGKGKVAVNSRSEQLLPA